MIVLTIFLLFSAYVGASPSLDDFTWPATEFKSTLDHHSACELLVEQDYDPNKVQADRLRKLKICATESIRQTLDLSKNKRPIPAKRKSQMRRLVDSLTKSQELFGYDRMHALGLIELKESLATLIAYDAFVPSRQDIETLTKSLNDRMAAGQHDELKWDLSILQGLTAIYNMASPADPIPSESCDQLITHFFKR